MSESQTPAPEEPFASLLAAWDEALASGRTAADMDPADLPPELRQRLVQALPFVQLLQHLRPSRPSTAVPGDSVPSQESQPVAVPPASEPVPYPRLGRFQVVGLLGQGAHGIVFLAHDPKLGREVALKVPRAEALVTPELRERFQREARAASGLDHPNIMPVYEAGSDGPICYIASAYCPGASLAQWLKGRSELVPLVSAVELTAALADGVEHAHSRGIVHRDLKPGNVLLRLGEGPPDTLSAISTLPSAVKITDFGLAKFLVTEDASRTESGAIVGTPAYMAPEQAGARGEEVGPAADIWALGAILYELLTGRPPFPGEDSFEVHLHLRTQEPVPPGRLRPNVPRDLETICLKCLQKEPRRRYATARDLADDLRRFQRGEPIAARPVALWERGVKWARRRPALAWLIAVALSAAVALAVLGMKYHLDLQESYADVSAEKDKAMAQRAEAEKQKRRAETNLAQALEAINKAHVRLSEVHLLNEPGQAPVRREVLGEAAQLYRQLLKEQSEDPAVQKQLGFACSRLALITAELETPAKGIPIAREGVTILDRLATKLEEVDRAAVAERYAARSVQLLQRARTAGQFRTSAQVERLLRDRRFGILRGRADYQSLVQDLRVSDR